MEISKPTPLTSHTHPAGSSGVINTRSDYYTIPSVDELDAIATAGNSSDSVEIENFTIGRHGYGVIVFPGKTDVCGLNLDELGKGIHYFTDDCIAYKYLNLVDSLILFS